MYRDCVEKGNGFRVAFCSFPSPLFSFFFLFFFRFFASFLIRHIRYRFEGSEKGKGLENIVYPMITMFQQIRCNFGANFIVTLPCHVPKIFLSVNRRAFLEKNTEKNTECE